MITKDSIIIFILLFYSSINYSQTDSLKQANCDTKSDCTGCNCSIKTDSKYVLGIDVAYQGIKGGLSDIKWDSVLTNNDIKFIFVKKSTGCDTSTKKVKIDSVETRVLVSIDNDKFFDENWNFLKKYQQKTQSNFYLGIYHYFYNNTSADMQAKTFLRNLKLAKDDLPPVLDLEDTAMYNIDGKTLGKNILDWIEQVEQTTKHNVIIYTSRYYWDKYKNKLDKESLKKIQQHAIWQAQFNKNKNEPNVLNGFNKWVIWQYCGDCYISGIKGQANVNIFNGSEQDLSDFIKSSIIE